MKKYILLLLFISSFLKADFLMIRTTKNDIYYTCITSYSFENNSIIFTSSRDSRTYTSNLNPYKDPIIIQSGYIFENDECKVIDKKLSDLTIINSSNLNYLNLSYLGLTQDNFNLLMALSGIFISFLFLLGLFISI